MRTLIAASAFAAILLGAPVNASAQISGSGSYCLKSASGAANCAYQSMAQCEQAKKTGDQCVSRSETTGAAPSGAAPQGGGSPAMPKSPSR
jgi:hypothetical protein